MVLHFILLKTSALILNVFSFVIPIAENIALKFRFSKCDCCYPVRAKSQNGYCLRSNKGKKRSRNQYSPMTKPNGTSATTTVEHYSYGSEVKRIKLLLDITMSEGTQPQVLNIHASTAHDERCNACSDHCEKKQWFFWKLINLPSSIVLYVTSKLQEYAYTLESVLEMDHEQHPVEDSNRIKKSPKRRISRANYRKILPFFPFNLLGFSNYTAFQMPSITRSSEETNNLNVSINGNGKVRSKRRRHSSTEEDASSLSENDISKVLDETPGTTLGGHDEVDSDETADTVTKQVSSSSSSSEPSSSKKFVIVPNCDEDLTPEADLDSRDIIEEEVQVVSSVLQELNEAANEAYNSEEDSDYKPVEGSSDDSSFNTDSCASEESFLAEIGVSVSTSTNDGGGEAASSRPKPAEEPESDFLPSSTMNPVHLDIGSVSTGCEDDYKTPEEEDDEPRRLNNFSEQS